MTKSLDEILELLDERHAVPTNSTEPQRFCDCDELVIHGKRLPMPKYHDCDYVRQRNAHIARAIEIADSLVPDWRDDGKSTAKWTLFFATAVDSLYSRNGATSR